MRPWLGCFALTGALASLSAVASPSVLFQEDSLLEPLRRLREPLELDLAATRTLVRRWERISVPGAHCGDGLPYSIFVSRGDPAKVAVDIMGGGACWSGSTCRGPELSTWIHPIPTVVEPAGILSPLERLSPIHDYTVVYFPYCTGDVHTGTHVADYGGKAVHHVGALNIRAAVPALRELAGVDLAGAEKFVLYGYSAGSLGALYHSKWIAGFVVNAREKTLIADSPGLHFGEGFWDRFSARMKWDFADAMASVGFEFDGSRTHLAALVPAVCAALPGWRVGVLQGSKDIIMSEVFGKVDQEWHDRLVYGREGVYQLTRDPSDPCSAWVPRSAAHTFLVTSATATIKAGRMSAMDYARSLIQAPAERAVLPNFR